MGIRFVMEGEEMVLRVVLDPETSRRLLAVADECHCDPHTVAAAMLHDVLLDDAIAHQFAPRQPDEPVHH